MTESAVTAAVCEGCSRLARELLPGGAGCCGVCEAWLELPRRGARPLTALRSELPPRERPARSPRGPLPFERRLRALVDELLRWHLARVQTERAQGGSYLPLAQRSSTAAVLEVLRLGVVGSGCSGTKGVWRGDAPEPAETWRVTASAETSRRYAALPPELRATADAIIADGRGDQVAEVELYSGRAVALCLEQRIGWALADAPQRAKWLVKIARRDSAPAFAGMEAVGRVMLGALVERWD